MAGRLIALLTLAVASGCCLSLGTAPSYIRALRDAQPVPVRMVGFGAKPKPQKQGGKAKRSSGFGQAPAQKKAVTSKSMATAYQRLTEREGAISIDVFARVDPQVATAFPGSATEPPEEGNDWLLVGRIAVAQPGTLQQAAQYQKRLILEHAAKISKRLRLQRRHLVCGLQTPYKVW